MQQIKVLKLTSGDTIVANVLPHNKEGFVVIEDPVQFTLSPLNNINRLIATPWLQTDETRFEIEKVNIVASAKPNNLLLEYYTQSLEEIQQLDEFEESVEEMFLDYGDTIH